MQELTTKRTKVAARKKAPVSKGKKKITVRGQNSQDTFNPLDYSESIARKTAIFDVRIKQLSFRRKVKASDVMEADSDTDLIHVSKDLIEQAELSAVRSQNSSFKKWLRERAVPCPMLRPGMFCLPMVTVPDVNQKVKEVVAEREVWRQDFRERYPALKEAAKKKLEPLGLYDESEYPPFSKIDEGFAIKTYYLSLNVPEELEKVNAEIKREAEQTMRREWAEATIEIRNALRAGFQTLITRGVQAISGEDDAGKKKSVRQSFIDQLNQFMELFPARNLTNDFELQQAVAQARALVTDIDAKEFRKQLKTDEDFKGNTLKAFTDIANKLDTMVVVRRRGVSLSEDV